jgi:hypothetical protein
VSNDYGATCPIIESSSDDCFSTSTATFRFDKRVRNYQDSPNEDYSPTARLYIVLLNSKGQLRGVDPLYMVGFTCVFAIQLKDRTSLEVSPSWRWTVIAPKRLSRW